MKHPIKWHVEILNRYKIHLEKQEKELKLLSDSIEKTRNKIDFYALQINEAIKQDKDGFDVDKFCKKRTK